MKSLLLAFTLLFSAATFAGTFTQCDSSQFQLNIQVNPDPESATMFTHFIIIVQKDGGVPVMAPVNETITAGVTTYSSEPEFQFALSINADGNGNLKMEDSNSPVTCH